MRYFYSDPHFLHSKICDFYPKSRPFNSEEEMREEMIRIFNAVVPPEAELVYHLGDFALVHADLHNLHIAQDILKGLNGQKHILIRGNHDKHGTEQIGFDEIHDSLQIKLGQENVLLHHYPLSSSDKITLHGHTHSGPVVQGKNINLNCEMNGLRPYSDEEVLKLLANR